MFSAFTKIQINTGDEANPCCMGCKNGFEKHAIAFMASMGPGPFIFLAWKTGNKVHLQKLTWDTLREASSNLMLVFALLYVPRDVWSSVYFVKNESVDRIRAARGIGSKVTSPSHPIWVVPGENINNTKRDERWVQTVCSCFNTVLSQQWIISKWSSVGQTVVVAASTAAFQALCDQTTFSELQITAEPWTKQARYYPSCGLVFLLLSVGKEHRSIFLWEWYLWTSYVFVHEAWKHAGAPIYLSLWRTKSQHKQHKTLDTGSGTSRSGMTSWINHIIKDKNCRMTQLLFANTKVKLSVTSSAIFFFHVVLDMGCHASFSQSNWRWNAVTEKPSTSMPAGGMHQSCQTLRGADEVPWTFDRTKIRQTRKPCLHASRSQSEWISVSQRRTKIQRLRQQSMQGKSHAGHKRVPYLCVIIRDMVCGTVVVRAMVLCQGDSSREVGRSEAEPALCEVGLQPPLDRQHNPLLLRGLSIKSTCIRFTFNPVKSCNSDSTKTRISHLSFVEQHSWNPMSDQVRAVRSAGYPVFGVTSQGTLKLRMGNSTSRDRGVITPAHNFARSAHTSSDNVVWSNPYVCLHSRKVLHAS